MTPSMAHQATTTILARHIITPPCRHAHDA
ncbi:hypothetical protein CCACVL1_21847 [Corchorus capsularis]|uniref:Uncharacterized protein n=1 Tax=Corchorus capsularis TaxID=210143 RepID=A0A1R3H1Y6_COCAP|nr:hypothetical protein CCACVL1_21847 [Corchorus capsularis]